MLRFIKTLKFQIGAALLSLVGLFAFFSMHMLSMLDEQQVNGALLRLATELQVTSQHMAMQAMNYKDNAPRDYAAYARDLGLYYQDLMVSTEKFGSVCRAFSSGDFGPEITWTHKSMRLRFDQKTRAAAEQLENYWNEYQAKLEEKLGSNKEEPRLEWAALHIIEEDHSLSELTRELLQSLEEDIQGRNQQTNQIIRIAFITAILLTSGIMLWFFLQILRPLNRSVQGFRKVSTGDFAYRVQVTGDNEISWLSQAFNQLSSRLDTLFKLTTHLQTGSDLDDTLHFVSQNFPQLLPLDWVGVLFVTNDEHIQLERVYSDGKPENIGILRFPLRETLLAQCLENNEPLHIPDVKEIAYLNPSYQFLQVLNDHQRRDAIFLPVTAQSPIPAVLVFASRQPNAYKAEHLELLSNLALVITLSFGRTLKLAEHTRLAAVGQFASGIAHEIRSPLATVSLALDYFKNADISEAANKRALLASSEVERMTHLLEDMLLYAKPLRIQAEPLDIHKLLRELTELYGQAAEEKSLSIELPESRETIRVSGDHDRLIQVFINLLKNAIDAATENSSIKFNVTADRSGNLVEVSINNQGEAIPAEKLEHLFEPFFTTKTTGTGLGLAIVKRLIEVHGGSINVTSDNQGTCFTVSLPIG